MSSITRFANAAKRALTNPRAVVVALVVSGLVAAAGGAALATRSASDHFANAAFEKLGGNSGDILNTIADKVVDKLTKKGGTIDDAQQELVDRLAGQAGKKLGKVDPSKIISSIRGDVVNAGLGKLNGISVDRIVAQVTSALIQQASTMLDKVDVEKLASAAISDVVKNLNLDKLVKEKIDSIDVDKLVSDAVAKQLGGSSGGSTNPLTSVLGSLLTGGMRR